MHYQRIIPEVSSACDVPWCIKDACGNDGYVSYQKKLRDTAGKEVKNQLDEIKDKYAKQAADGDALKGTMAAKGLIQLLPGVVPGFVLRNRKWGERNRPLQ